MIKIRQQERIESTFFPSAEDHSLLFASSRHIRSRLYFFNTIKRKTQILLHFSHINPLKHLTRKVRIVSNRIEFSRSGVYILGNARRQQQRVKINSKKLKIWSRSPTQRQYFARFTSSCIRREAEVFVVMLTWKARASCQGLLPNYHGTSRRNLCHLSVL